MQKILHIIARGGVASICLFLAIVTMFFIPPSASYLEYIDWKVIVLLFSLMTVVCGLSKAKLFSVLSDKLISTTSDVRRCVGILTALCFFFSMLLTNDVALITLVPFAITILMRTNMQHHIIYTIVLQTAAANLGSMLTPVGNPQNLFLYSYYHMSPKGFFLTTLPVTLLSMVILFALVFLVKPEPIQAPQMSDDHIDKKSALIYAALFAICILSVFGVVHYLITLAVVLIVVIAYDRHTLASVDYGLLVTFLCFFIFVGNIGCIEVIRETITKLATGHELISSALLSQVISNVPAAVLLSGFTQNANALLLGVNIGGLGTLIASLASLISFRLYSKTEGAKRGRFLGVFTVINVLLLAVLGAFAVIFYHIPL